MARVQEQHAGPDELVLGEALILVEDLGERRDEVVPLRTAALARQGAQVGGELAARAYGVLLERGRWIELVHLADIRRPGTQELPVALGHAEHLGDHGDGERLGEGREQIDIPGSHQRVQQLVDERLDPRTEPFDVRRREGLRHQSPDARVIGRLHVQDAGVDELPERVVPTGRIGTSHLGMRGDVEVRAAEPPVPQERG